jgi:tubulin polyglutamylase TTLL9
MRVYALVSTYNPLKVFVYRNGFCRFSGTRYSAALSDIENNCVHLTNVAVQKESADYNPDTGGKWELRPLKMMVAARHGRDAADRLFKGIEDIILRSLFSVQKVMISDKHCFELYGYDVLFDDALKPWLIEVNASPSVSVGRYECASGGQGWFPCSSPRIRGRTTT